MVDAYLHEGKLDEATYREQFARRGSDMNEARAQQLTSSVETVHLDRALDFAPKLLTNPAGFWETLLPERRPVLQRAIYPDGMRYREGTLETAEISLVFSYFRSFDTADSQMASRACIEPNTNRGKPEHFFEYSGRCVRPGPRLRSRMPATWGARPLLVGWSS